MSAAAAATEPVLLRKHRLFAMEASTLSDPPCSPATGENLELSTGTQMVLFDSGRSVTEGDGSSSAVTKEAEETAGRVVQGSFREKIIAFEKFSGQGKGQKDSGGLKSERSSRRWGTLFSSSSSSPSPSSSSSSAVKTSARFAQETSSNGSKDTENKNKSCCQAEAPLASRDDAGQLAEPLHQPQQPNDGNAKTEDSKRTKVHWTVRFSQRLMKIRGQLEHRCQSEQRNDKSAKYAGLELQPTTLGSRSSISNIFHASSSDSGLGNSSTCLSSPERESLISRSCSELSQAGNVEPSQCDESLIRSGRRKRGKHESIIRSTTNGAHPSFPGAVEKEEAAGEGKIKQSVTKTSFISELRKLYDRSCDRKPEGRRFFRSSKKNTGTGRFEDTTSTTYIEADRIDRDITLCDTAGSPSSEDSAAAETDLKVTSADGISNDARCPDEDEKDPEAGICKNSSEAAGVSEGTGNDVTDCLEKKGSAAMVTEGNSGGPVAKKRNDDDLGPEIDTESVKNKKQVTPVPWRKQLSVFTEGREPDVCKVIDEEWRSQATSVEAIDTE